MSAAESLLWKIIEANCHSMGYLDLNIPFDGRMCIDTWVEGLTEAEWACLVEIEAVVQRNDPDEDDA